jgi:2-polyprenyl-3-methyl-5-hydroxy-6-metoxy-1,4-benzoquinol methylase
MASHVEIKKRVIASYRSGIIRLYCQIRFLIMNMRILEEIEQYLPKKGFVLDAGCGFGLFSLYFACCEKERRLHSFDLNSDRIRQARESSSLLGLDGQIEFEDCNILDFEFKQKVDAIVLLDLLHHIPTSAVPDLIGHFYKTIADDGVVLIKDIESKPWYKVAFTWILDKAMDPKTPVNYYSKTEMTEMLEGHGFDVKSHQMLDILPYPHILYICRKTRPE